MKKLLSLLGVGVLVAMWSGCGVTNPVSAPRITIDQIGTIAIGTNDVVKQITGKIEADTAIASINATVETAAGVAVPTSQISVTTPAGTTEKTMTLTANSGFNLTIKSAALAGSYKLKITVVAGATADASFDFTLTGNGGTAVTTANVTLGSYANTTTGSSVDLDANPPAVMMASAAVATGSGVDLVGTYSANPSYMSLRLFSPVYARDNSGINAFSAWPDAAATTMVKVTGTAFSAITTVEQIKPLYDAGAAVTSLTCSVGDVVVVKTDQNKYVAIDVVSFDQTTDGQLVLKYGK